MEEKIKEDDLVELLEADNGLRDIKGAYSIVDLVIGMVIEALTGILVLIANS